MTDSILEKSAAVSALAPVIKRISDDVIVEQLALALIEDLKSLCEVYKEKEEGVLRHSSTLGICTSLSWVLLWAI